MVLGQEPVPSLGSWARLHRLIRLRIQRGPMILKGRTDVFYAYPNSRSCRPRSLEQVCRVSCHREAAQTVSRGPVEGWMRVCGDCVETPLSAQNDGGKA